MPCVLSPLTRERKPPMRSFTDTFIKHPVLAIVVNLVLAAGGLARAEQSAGAAVSTDRKLVRGDHHGLHRRQRGDGARLSHDAHRARRLGDQRRGLPRIDQPRRRQHGDGAAQAQSQQHGGPGRSHGAAAAGALRAAGGGGAARRRGAACGSTVRLVLSELHLDQTQRTGSDGLAPAHAAAAALRRCPACSA